MISAPAGFPLGVRRNVTSESAPANPTTSSLRAASVLVPLMVTDTPIDSPSTRTSNIHALPDPGAVSRTMCKPRKYVGASQRVSALPCVGVHTLGERTDVYSVPSPSDHDPPKQEMTRRTPIAYGQGSPRDRSRIVKFQIWAPPGAWMRWMVSKSTSH